MACEVARSPFNEQHTLEDGWLKSTEDGNNVLDTIPEFGKFSGGKFSGSELENATIDTHALSNPSSPAASYTEGFNPCGVDGTPSPEPTLPADFTSSQAPYFYPSIEESNTTAMPSYASASTRHSFRRSVSEPPDGMQLPPHIQHYPQLPAAPNMTFHRDGHWLGNPKYPGAKRLKSLPKSKHSGQPYKTKMPPPTHAHHRYQLRRTQRQPVRGPPTSAPGTPMMGPPLPPHPHPFPPALSSPMRSPVNMMPHQRVYEPLPIVPEQQNFISSRVCTPTSEEMHSPTPASMMTGAQSQIDPLLTTSATPSIPPGGEQATAVTVPLTVEQLRGMIVEAVQKAVESLSPKMGAAASIEKQEEGDKQDVVTELAQPKGLTEEQAGGAGTEVKEIQGEDILAGDDELEQKTVTSEELEEIFSS